MSRKRILLWDLPTRLFHWLLVASVAAAIVTGQLGGGLIDWHGRIGLFIVGLLAFRLTWGLVGSTYARFAQFFPTPAKIQAHLAGRWKGEGHNPLGAVSVLALLGLLSLQVATGLFANDDIAFSGPLFDLISKAASNRLTGLHHLASKLLIALVLLHIGAIAFYGHVKKQNLIQPMVTGRKDDAEGDSATGGGFISLVAALCIAGVVMWGASGAWLPAPPPSPPAGETPSW